MRFLKSLFGGSKEESKGEQLIEEHLEFLTSLKIPAIALSASSNEKLSRIGGLPSLPDSEPWPEWQGRPLAFLCQLHLGDIPTECERHGLPPTGMLYFFYLSEQETWGFDPKDKGSWRVVHSATPSSNSTQQSAPDGLEEEYIYSEKPVAFTPIDTYPNWQDERVQDLDLNDSQFDQYTELCSSVFGDNPAHHLFGYPSPIQGNDMDLECQLVTHGLYCGDGSGYQDPRAKELESNRRDWILLLQLDTDDDVGMMWGDCGMLYFWIRRQDLEKGRFDKCWMILQCS